jgi:hypothetical protein
VSHRDTVWVRRAMVTVVSVNTAAVPHRQCRWPLRPELAAVLGGWLPYQLAAGCCLKCKLVAVRGRCRTLLPYPAGLMTSCKGGGRDRRTCGCTGQGHRELPCVTLLTGTWRARPELVDASPSRFHLGEATRRVMPPRLPAGEH